MKLDLPEQTSCVLLTETQADAFETGVLSVLRYFGDAFENNKIDSMHSAYAQAAMEWGAAYGLQVAQHLYVVVSTFYQYGKTNICFADPEKSKENNQLTEDELHFLEALHHMRRSKPGRAQSAIGFLTDKRMDAGLIHAMQTFAAKYSVTNADRVTTYPKLSVVK